MNTTSEQQQKRATDYSVKKSSLYANEGWFSKSDSMREFGIVRKIFGRRRKKRVYLADAEDEPVSHQRGHVNCFIKTKSKWIRDLTQEGIEPNPGPLSIIPEEKVLLFEPGVYVVCLECDNQEMVADATNISIIHTPTCDQCLYNTQSFLSEEALGDIRTKTNGLRNWLMNGNKHGESFLSHYIKIPQSLDANVNLLEDISILAYQLMHSNNTTDRYVSIINFCKLRGSRISFTQSLLYIVTDLFGSVVKNSYENKVEQARQDEWFAHGIIEKLDYEAQQDYYANKADYLKYKQEKYASQGEEYQVQFFENYQGDNVFATARMYLGCYDKLKETTIYKKLYKLLLYLMCLGLLDNTKITFDSLNFTKFEREAALSTHKPGFDMVHCMLDTVCFICDRGVQYFKTGDAEVIFHSGKAYEAWYSKATKLTMDAKFLKDPEPHGINRFSFISDLKDAIEKGNAILKFTAGLDKFEKMSLQKILNELKMIECDELTRKAAQMPRKDPFSVLLHGSSSIGKSQLKQILFYHYGKIFKLPVSAEYMYTRCPTDEYWSGFNSTQWCIVMDDIAFLKPNGEVDPTLKEMLQVKNSVPYCPPQASLEDKGRTPIRAELLLATTNTKHMNLHAYFACPFAIARRMNYVITAKVKSEYSKNNFMLDSSKIPVTPNGEYMNVWNFEISVPEPERDIEIDNQQSRYRVIKTFTDINDLLVWYIEAAKEHEVSNAKALSADNTMLDITVCETCYRAQQACICFATQVEETWEGESNGSWTDDEIDTFSVSPSIAEELREMHIASTRDRPARAQVAQPSSLEKFVEELSYYQRMQLCVYKNIILGSANDLPVVLSDYLDCLPSGRAFIILLTCIFMLAWRIFLPLLPIVGLVYLIYTYIWVFLHGIACRTLGIMWKFNLLFKICGNTHLTYKCLYYYAGERVKRIHFEIPHLKKLAIFVSAPLVLLTIRKLYNTYTTPSIPKNMHTQGSIGSVPTPHMDEKPTFYYHDPYAVTEVEISGASKCAQDDILRNKVKRNTAKMIFAFADGLCTRTTGLNICGNIWMLNKHSLKATTGSVSLIFDPIEQNVSRNIKNILFKPMDVIVPESGDLAFIQIKSVPPGCNLVKYFPLDKLLSGRYAGEYIHITAAGVKHTNKIVNIFSGRCPALMVPGYHGRSTTVTQVGDCGSACIAKIGNAQVILGTHTSGSAQGGIFMQHVSQKILNEILTKYEPQVECGVIPISAKDYPRSIAPVHQKATMRWIPEGNSTVLGSFVGYRPKHKSKVKKTYIRDYVVNHGYCDKYGPPDMTWKPWNLALVDMVTQTHNVDTEILKECKDAFFNDIKEALGDKIKELMVYTQDVALNGADGVTYVDKLNFSTSAGHPYKKAKKNFINFDENNKAVSLDPTIQERIDEIEETYAKGKQFHPIFCGHLKDEPVSRKKQASGKTRVFAGAEFAWSVVVRKFLLSHIRMIQNNPFIFEAMPGVVAQSIEWHRLYKFLTEHGLFRLIAGDYAKFDKRMRALFILAAFDILIDMAREAGFSEEELMVIRSMSYDVAFGTYDFNGELMQIEGNPSGHPLTVIINCLVNSLYMRYVFHQISGFNVRDFKKYVNLATYGDDNAMGVSPLCDKFNHTAIAECLAKIGVEYTMADKESKSIPFVHINDITFLKRSFRFDEDIGTIVGPLEHDSLDKMLTNYVDKGILAPEAHSISSIETALREYFFYGKEVYAKKVAFFQNLIVDLQLQAWVQPSTLPDYYTLVYDFWMRFGDEENASRYGKKPTETRE